MLSSDVNHDLCVSRNHFRPILAGGALDMLGAPAHLRLFSILIGAMRDECDGCVSDTLDAIALDPAISAMVHRIGGALAGEQVIVYGTDEADEIVERLGAVPFPIRRQMVHLGARQVKAFLDDQQPPQAII